MHLTNQIAGLNIVSDVIFRSVAALFLSFLLSIIFFPYFINIQKKLHISGQPIRQDGPSGHIIKKGTVTMGGIIIIISALLSTLLWCDLKNPYLYILWFAIFGYGILGFMDDFFKIKYQDTRGISAKMKFTWQGIIGILITSLCVYFDPSSEAMSLTIPFIKDYMLNISWFYIIFGSVVMIAASNSVNITDGLDGLVIMPLIIIFGYFAFITYLVGHLLFSQYLQIHYIPKLAELTVFCSSLIGACLGFLWYNAQPARIFMGDVGSLALGGAVGTLAIITKQEITLIFVGGLFVMETLSVIIQVLSFRLRGKRIFIMAPIHHHFEKIGWSETTIVVRMWIISILCVFIGLMMLKIR